jgi:heptosyltransferase-3
MNLPVLRRAPRILFLTSTRIGDVVLSTGLLGLLAETYPTARITVAAGYLTVSLFDAAPAVEKVIALRKRRWNLHWLELYARLFRPWDLVVDLRSSALGWLVPTAHRRISGRSDAAEARVIELARLVDAAPPPAPRVWLEDRDRQAAAVLVPAGTPFLAVAPGASSGGKQWPPDRFADLTRRLTAPGAIGQGLRIVLLGAAEERHLVAAVESHLGDLPPDRRPIAILGETRLPVVAALLQRAALYIGNDSGLMHLAAATGAPTIGLFGPTSATRYGPWGPKARVVQAEDPAEDGGFRPPGPIAELTVERVLDSVARFAPEIGLPV